MVKNLLLFIRHQKGVQVNRINIFQSSVFRGLLLLFRRRIRKVILLPSVSIDSVDYGNLIRQVGSRRHFILINCRSRRYQGKIDRQVRIALGKKIHSFRIPLCRNRVYTAYVLDQAIL